MTPRRDQQVSTLLAFVRGSWCDVEGHLVCLLKINLNKELKNFWKKTWKNGFMEKIYIYFYDNCNI